MVEAGGHSIGLVHSLWVRSVDDELFPGFMARKFPAGASLPMELEEVFGRPVDIVVFGHTHEALVELYQGVLLINPGSTNMVKQSLKLGTVAVLELTASGKSAKIIDLAGLPG